MAVGGGIELGPNGGASPEAGNHEPLFSASEGHIIQSTPRNEAEIRV